MPYGGRVKLVSKFPTSPSVATTTMSNSANKFLALITVVIACACVLLWIRVPTREFTDVSWFNSSDLALAPAEPNGAMRRMITRAQIAYFIDPAVPGTHAIFFDRAWSGPGNDIYLTFGLVGMTDEVIIYFGALNSGRLYWKASESRSP